MTRKEAIKRAMGSMMLEGFVYTAEEKEIFEKIGDGLYRSICRKKA